MQKHFKKCLLIKNISSFLEVPHVGVTDRNTCYTKRVDVFWNCTRPAKISRTRGLEKKEEMAQCDGCKEWFYRSYEKIPPNMFKIKNIEWYCQSCVKMQ